MDFEDRLPDLGLIATALGVVVLAVALWAAISLARGELIQPLEALMFALVFAVIYFGSLSLLDSSGETGSESG